MERTLLIGNGLNRTIDDYAWGNLLQDIACEFGVPYHQEISMPLEFERIVNSKLEIDHETIVVNNVLSQAKQKVAEKTKGLKLPADAIHHRLREICFENIITTNYDLLLEYAFDSRYSYDGSKLKKYLFESTSVIDSHSFFHMHGICESYKSLCLGYEHYMGIVEKNRSFLNTKKDNDPYQMNIKRILYEDEPKMNTWGEKFYTSDIAILGLELSNAEVDLWWLITHRASLYYSDYAKLRQRGKLKNKIVYYDVIDGLTKKSTEEDDYRKKKVSEQRIKHKLLVDEHVEVKTYELGTKFGSYAEAYNQMLTDIKSEYGSSL